MHGIFEDICNILIVVYCRYYLFVFRPITYSSLLVEYTYYLVAILYCHY